jgi:hypothetical protein
MTNDARNYAQKTLYALLAGRARREERAAGPRRRAGGLPLQGASGGGRGVRQAARTADGGVETPSGGTPKEATDANHEGFAERA